jgi:hypothetical protein
MHARQIGVACHESCPEGKTEQFPLDGPAAKSKLPSYIIKMYDNKK